MTSIAGGSRRKTLTLAIAFVSLAFCFAVDRILKSWALANLPFQKTVPFIPGFLQLTLTTNTGAAFSLGHENGSMMMILASLLTTALAAWLVSRVVRREEIPPLELIGIGCLLGGSIGNLFDRFTLGRVTDFIEFAFMSFPVFNPADVFIDVGLGLILIAHLIKSKTDKEPEEQH